MKTRHFTPRVSDIGTVNPVVLDCPMFQYRSLNPTFDEVSDLSTRASELRSEIIRLKSELESLTTSEPQTKYTKFKKAEMDFAKKLDEREAELENFAKFLNVYRVDSNPTFVEIEALQSQRNRPIFDAINASLLVSNPQRSFFRRNDIEFQNEELKGIIGEQEQTLRVLEARLKLFSSYQSANTPQFTVDSLRRGMTPTILGSRTPTQVDEITAKHKALSNELASLVRERNSLKQKRIAAKLVRRRRRERVRRAMTGHESIRSGTPTASEIDVSGKMESLIDAEHSVSILNVTSNEAGETQEQALSDETQTEGQKEDSIGHEEDEGNDKGKDTEVSISTEEKGSDACENETKTPSENGKVEASTEKQNEDSAEDQSNERQEELEVQNQESLECEERTPNTKESTDDGENEEQNEDSLTDKKQEASEDSLQNGQIKSDLTEKDDSIECHENIDSLTDGNAKITEEDTLEMQADQNELPNDSL